MPRAIRRCGAKGCDNPMPCKTHARPRDLRPSGSKRYPHEHQQERARWVPIVAAGNVVCRRAPSGKCLRPDDPVIHPGEPWHLGHPDLECDADRAPEHLICNVATNLPGRRRRG